MLNAKTLEEKLELIASMLELAKQIVEELKCGETVETCADADHAINEARSLGMALSKLTNDH